MGYKKGSGGVYAIDGGDIGVYVGGTRNFKPRWTDHRHHLRHGTHFNSRLQEAWTASGENAFRFVVLETIEDMTILREREEYWVDLKRASGQECFNVLSPLYLNLGLKHSEETRRKMSMSLRGKPMSDEQRQKLSAIHKERMKNPAAVEIALSGIREWINSPGARESISRRRKGYKLTPEELAAHAERMKKVGLQPETKEKRRRDTQAMWNDPERRQRMLDARISTAKTHEGFTAPDGTVYRNIFNLRAFAREHGLSPTALTDVHAGRIKSHKGWTRIKNDLAVGLEPEE